MDKKETDSFEFETAYLQTNYVVQNEERQIIIRIGEYNLALDELLKLNKAESWAFITAYNPYSNSLPVEENENRQAKLLTRLKESNFRFLNG